ncbi:MAG: divergent polysaccharide deacetylase family protein [Spirochaetaceae bacterium]|nr:divergent polysaccharide deacetylase family protein [Spirochaetaceae bacterium]MCF7948542.1 divergent polysaccharide deacetylase family protein [Spirochaetia bacterium]MCF7951867.1 divergent polysaccharide deacetylase family protein [Spirochaetaceae bacterium]
MKKASDNQPNKSTTSKPDSTENPTGPAHRTSKKKGRTPSQRRRVQLAYALLTLIAVSLFILLVLLPRPDSRDLTGREKIDGREDSPEMGTEGATEGEESRQIEPGPLTALPSSDGSETTGTDADDPSAMAGESEKRPKKRPEGYGDETLSEEYTSEEEKLDLHPLEKITEPPAGRGKLYLVIDDVGYNLEQLDNYLDLPIPMTFALLPGLEFSRAAQEQIARSGDEMILHQPIEPLGDEDPGPGALYVGMQPEEMRKIVNKNLDQLPRVIGVNNHMGSKGTANPELMEALFSVLKGRQLYFLDSRTTADTVGNTVAEKLGMPFSERNVFLDNIEDPLEIELALSSALEVARSQGYAVMIGHVWSRELASTLSLWYGKIEDRGYEFVHLSSFFAEEHVYAGNGN